MKITLVGVVLLILVVIAAIVLLHHLAPKHNQPNSPTSALR